MSFTIRVSECGYVGAREIQQDAYGCTAPGLYSQKGMLAVLSDGIGGMRDGERFSKLAVDVMRRQFEASDEGQPLSERLLRAYEAARAAAKRECGDPDDPEGGATVAAVAIHGGRCAFLSAGDSRIYLMRVGGLILLNREQKLALALDEYAALGYISRQDAQTNTQRAALTNHLCEPRDRQPDMGAEPFRLRHGDRLALLSDGVFSALDEEEIRKAMAAPPARAASVMIDAVKQKGLAKQDNSSAVIITVTRKRRNAGEGRKEA